MAVQTAEKFLERLLDEPTLRAQLRVHSPRDLQQFLTFAMAKGFIFSEEDLRAALKTHPVDFIKV